MVSVGEESGAGKLRRLEMLRGEEGGAEGGGFGSALGCFGNLDPETRRPLAIGRVGCQGPPVWPCQCPNEISFDKKCMVIIIIMHERSPGGMAMANVPMATLIVARMAILVCKHGNFLAKNKTAAELPCSFN